MAWTEDASTLSDAYALAGVARAPRPEEGADAARRLREDAFLFTRRGGRGPQRAMSIASYGYGLGDAAPALAEELAASIDRDATLAYLEASRASLRRALVPRVVARRARFVARRVAPRRVARHFVHPRRHAVPTLADHMSAIYDPVRFSDGGGTGLEASWWSKIKSATSRVSRLNKGAISKMTHDVSSQFSRKGVVGRIFVQPKMQKNIKRLALYKKLGTYAVGAAAVGATVWFGGPALVGLLKGDPSLLSKLGDIVKGGKDVAAVAADALGALNADRAAKGQPPVTPEQVNNDPTLTADLKYKMIQMQEQLDRVGHFESLPPEQGRHQQDDARPGAQGGSPGEQVQGSWMDALKNLIPSAAPQPEAPATAQAAAPGTEAPQEQGMLGGIPPMALALGAIAVGAYLLNRKHGRR